MTMRHVSKIESTSHHRGELIATVTTDRSGNHKRVTHCRVGVAAQSGENQPIELRTPAARPVNTDFSKATPRNLSLKASSARRNANLTFGEVVPIGSTNCSNQLL